MEKVLVVGSGLSGRSAHDYLKNKGYHVTFASQEEINSKQLSNENLDRLFSGLSFIVTSPGVSPKIHLLKEAKKRKIKIVGEFELGSTKLNGDIIAVTGTNGKTTTVSLISFLLKEHDSNVFVGGNIGVAVTSFCNKTQNDDISVLECSSFQLESIKNFHPHIACILNITEDHLNRHVSMKNYISCKNKITKNQTSNDFLLLNFDDELVMKNHPKTKAKIFYFSTKTKVVGCYLKRNDIYFNDSLNEKKLISLKNLKLVGEHNLSNVLCAVLAVFLETKNTKHLKTVCNFEGVPHRIEYVQTVQGVAFFNDSKATNIDSSLVALKSFECNINLILGGSDKGYNFDKLFEKMPKNVKNIAIFGETKHKIAVSAKKYCFKNFYLCDNLKSATHLCYELSKPKEIVLLSPACASFDFFNNYEERGNFFKKIVKEIFDDENALFKSSKMSQT